MQLPAALCQVSPMLDDGEADLVERAKRDPQAFSVLYRRHYSAMAGYVFRRTGDVHLTEDLVADVFLTAMRFLPRYRQRGAPFRAWLYRIATTSVNRWARRNRRMTEETARRLEARRDGDRSPVGHVGHADAANCDAELARLALLSLSPKHQAVLSLHYLEGLSVDEVAETIDCRVGTVKSRLSRGRNALRERLLRGRYKL